MHIMNIVGGTPARREMLAILRSGIVVVLQLLEAPLQNGALLRLQPDVGDPQVFRPGEPKLNSHYVHYYAFF